MVDFGFTHAWVLTAWFNVVFWQWSAYTMGRSKSKYSTMQFSGKPPAWVFPVAWTLIYAALVATGFYFTYISGPDSWQIIIGFIVLMLHLIANKAWSVAFWDWANPALALYILFLVMIPTGLLFYVPAIIDQTGTILFIIPVIGITLNNLWLLYAAFLNYQVVFAARTDVRFGWRDVAY